MGLLQTLCFPHSEVLPNPPFYSQSPYSTVVHQHPRKSHFKNGRHQQWGTQTESSKTVESQLLKSVAKEEEMNLEVIKPNHMSLLHFCTRVKYTGPHRRVGEMANHNLTILHFLHCRSKSRESLKILLEGFPSGAVVKNPPASAGGTGSSPGPGRSHMLRSN